MIKLKGKKWKKKQVGEVIEHGDLINYISDRIQSAVLARPHVGETLERKMYGFEATVWTPVGDSE